MKKSTPRLSHQPPNGIDSEEYESLAKLIEPYVDGPFDKLPDGLRQRVIEAFDFESEPFDARQWGKLTPDKRRSLAKQWDLDIDPAKRPEFDYWRALTVAVQQTESAQLDWDLRQPQSITELETKEDRLAAIDGRLRNLAALRKMPRFSVQNWDVLTDDALAEVVADAPGPEQNAATPAPVAAESASGGVEPDKAGLKVGEGSADAPKRGTQQAAGSPKFSMRLRALIEAHIHEWPTIETDIKAASDNGLSTAKAGARNWWEEHTMEWARANGKLKIAAKPGESLAQAMHNMGSLPGRKHMG